MMVESDPVHQALAVLEGFTEAFKLEQQVLTDRLIEVRCLPRTLEALPVWVVLFEFEIIIERGGRRSELANSSGDRRLLEQLLTSAAAGVADAR